MSKDDIQCPYCGADQEILHDDGQGCEEDVLHRQECTVCGKTYAYETSIDVSHEAFAAPCIDDGNHKWEETHATPRCMRKLRCSVCGEEKEIEGIQTERDAYFAEMESRK